jgi:hypothetical protein
MVADQADLTRLGREGDALVGLRPVADEVAQAPGLVGSGRLDVGQDGLESGQIAVDV